MRLTTCLYYLILCSCLALSARAATVSVKLNDPNFSVAPAEDLVYAGAPIDSSQAIELGRQGVDLSRLDPRPSNLWKDQKLPPNNQSQLGLPDEGALLKFKEFKTSPSEIFRAVVISGEDQFTLTASLDNHSNILRAGLLRLLGYDVDTPKYYKSLKLSFESKEQKEKFLEVVGEQTLTRRDRWVRDDSDETVLEVKGLTLEPAELRNVNIYLPVMSRARQTSRRIFRALLNVYVLTDFPQSVNSISWEQGREFNQSLLFNHPYAAEFSNVALDDMLWMQRRIARLGRADLRQAISATGLPSDISQLILEKLSSRVNHMSSLLRLKEPPLRFDKDISIGKVRGGKLVEDAYADDYVAEFYKEDELSPYRFWEVFRLFRTQATYAGMSSLLDEAVEKFAPGLRLDDALETIQNDMADYRQANPQLQGVMPLRAFVAPLASGRAFANRNVIFGQYLGSNAPIQLVDTVGGEVSLGAFGNFTGLADNILPSASATVSVGRSYTHARAMPDLKTATSQDLRKIFIPGHFKALGRVIKDEYSCGIPESPYVEEADLNGEKLFYVKYDPAWERGRERAVEKRAQMIADGTTETILLVQIDRETQCGEDLAQTRKEHLEEFLKQFALNEMFIINDTLRLGARLNIPIPLLSAGAAAATANLGSESTTTLLRSVIVRKTESGMEVTVQNRKDLGIGFSQNISYFIELAALSTVWTDGNMVSHVYHLDLEGLDEDRTAKALKALRSLFTQNDRRLVEDYPAIELDHDVATKLTSFRLLFYKSEHLKMNHEVEIVVPNKEGENYSLEERTRSLYSVMNMKRTGKDYFTFFDRVLSALTGFLSLGSANSDPGKTFMGSSKKIYVSAEAEITPSRPAHTVGRVEFIWTGWNKKSREMNEIFDQVDALFAASTDRPVIKRSILFGTRQLKSYDVRTSIILYPAAMERIRQTLFEQSELTALAYLKYMYGETKWDGYCRRSDEFFGATGPHLVRVGRQQVCAPPSARRILGMRSNAPTIDRRLETTRINNLTSTLFKELRPDRVLEILGKTSFFATTRVTGFRESSPEGVLDYISDSVGKYDNEYGTGIFDMVAGQIGLSSYEARAMMYTPSM